METKLSGRVALVTGAGKRLGRAVALRLAGEGADLAVHYRGSDEGAREVVEEIEKLGRHAVAMRAELTGVEEIRVLVQKVAHEFGRIDVLVNSAANFLPSSVISTTEEIWDASLDTNVKGPFFFGAGSGSVVAASEWSDCEFRGYGRNFGLARLHCTFRFEGGNDYADENVGESVGAGCAGERDCSGDDYDAGRSAGVGKRVCEAGTTEKDGDDDGYCGGGVVLGECEVFDGACAGVGWRADTVVHGDAKYSDTFVGGSGTGAGCGAAHAQRLAILDGGACVFRIAGCGCDWILV